jgi:quercetin dioxygenase-like cupin family protein
MLKRGHAAAATIAAVLFLASLAAAQATKAVDLAEDPSATLLLENEYVRVWRIMLGPQKASAMHKRDYDYVMVPLSEAQLDSHLADGRNDLAQPVYPGGARFSSRGTPRQLRNTSTARTLEMILVEVLRGQVRPAGVYDRETLRAHVYDRFPLALDYEKSFHVTHETPALLGTDQQLVPGDSTAAHEHRGPHLVIAITDLELRSQPSSGEPQMLRASAGDVQWVPAGVKHKLTNVGGKPAR